MQTNPISPSLPFPSPARSLSPVTRFRTIMAYSTNCAGRPRVNVFSNPNMKYLGIPQGTASANNALVLNNAMVRSLFRFRPRSHLVILTHIQDSCAHPLPRRG